MRRRQARSDRFKADFFGILRGHQANLANLLDQAVAQGAEAADPERLKEARSDALRRLVENFARRQEAVM